MKIVKVRDVKTPTRGHSSDAGVDFYIPNELPNIFGLTHSMNFVYTTIYLKPQQSICIPSGIKMIIPHGYAGIFLNKSSIGKQGLLVGGQVVDSGYRGEIHLDLHNTSNDDISIEVGQKIAQMLIVPVRLAAVEEISEEEFNINQTSRGSDA